MSSGPLSKRSTNTDQSEDNIIRRLEQKLYNRRRNNTCVLHIFIYMGCCIGWH